MSMSRTEVGADKPTTWDRQSRGPAEGSTFNRIKTTVADKLRSAAHTVHEKSASREGQNEKLSGYGNQAADWLDRSADYIEEVNPQQIKADIENQVRRNPGRSLLIAGAVGLALGAILRRR